MQNKPHYTANIGDRIRKYRLFRNMTQKQLADECMLSESAIRNYELGNRIPDEKTIRDIADILEIDNALLRDIDPEDISSMERLFYDMEAIYGIVPQFIDGELHIIFKRPDKNSSNRDIINHYYLEEQILVESCRRAEGLMPAPVFDSDKNLLDIPKRKKDKPSPEEASAQYLSDKNLFIQ